MRLTRDEAFIKESKKGLDKRSLDLEKAIKGTKGVRKTISLISMCPK